MCKMGSYLMSTAGKKGHFHKEEALVLFQHLVSGANLLEAFFGSVRYADCIPGSILFVVSDYDIAFLWKRRNADTPVYLVQLSAAYGGIDLPESGSILCSGYKSGSVPVKPAAYRKGK